MGRWTQYDEDSYRLPEGMERIGYDSDSGRYYFRDTDGSIWKGGEGAEFGEMTKVSNLPTSLSPSDTDFAEELSSSEDDSRRGGPGHDLEASPRIRSSGYQLLSSDHARLSYSLTSSYRSIFPFFLIIAVVLLLFWRLIVSPSLTAPSKKCPSDTSVHWIQPGETCWEVSRHYGWTLDKFKEMNPKVVCDPLMPGTSVCLPVSSKVKASARRVQGSVKRRM